MKTDVRCPTCAKTVSLGNENRFRPFCSERCRLIDLGEWVQETYTIADNETPLSEQELEKIESTLKH